MGEVNAIEPPQRSPAQLADSITQLTGDLLRLKAEKKTVVQGYNQRIRDLEEEISGEQQQYEQLKAKENP